MQLPIVISRQQPRTLQGQIYEQVRALILNGRLKPGQPLPSSRALAAELEVSRNTVAIAYDRLITEGYLQTRAASNTFVGADLPEESILQNLRYEEVAPPAAPAARRVTRQSVAFQSPGQDLSRHGRAAVEIDFFVGRPDPESFPFAVWRRLLVRNLAAAETWMTEYGDPAGYAPLRRAIARHLGPARGIRAEPNQIIVTSGIQEALNIVARLFVRDGTPVATENPCYQGVFNVFKSYGARLVPVPVDGEGLVTAELPKKPVALLCVTPSHQFPTGYTLSLERRFRLLDWAAETGAYLVEDDYDSDFRYDGPPLTALAGLDARNMVIYLGTFSKSIGAGLRIGYLMVPPELVAPAVAAKSILDNGRGWLDQSVLADFLAEGHFVRHLRRIRMANKSRRDRLIAALAENFGDVVLAGRRGGMHVMWRLADTLPAAAEVETRARAVGVGIYALPSAASYDYGGCPYSERCMIIGYPALTEERIAEGIARLAQALGIRL